MPTDLDELATEISEPLAAIHRLVCETSRYLAAQQHDYSAGQIQRALSIAIAEALRSPCGEIAVFDDRLVASWMAGIGRSMVPGLG